jgi:pimeloyl-ACP methyl ester carboxylesterase
MPAIGEKSNGCLCLEYVKVRLLRSPRYAECGSPHSTDSLVGLRGHSMPKVPNCGFSSTYHIDFVSLPSRRIPMAVDVEKSRKINGQILKTALLTSNARPGQLAIHEPRLAACVVHYGALPTKPADIERIKARTLGIFGALDRGIPPNKVRAFEKRMNAVKKLVEIKIYDDAGHAFENPVNTRGYRPKAAADAWRRTLSFLDRSL